MSVSGEVYTAGKNFTLPTAVTAVTNLTSDWSHIFFVTWYNTVTFGHCALVLSAAHSLKKNIVQSWFVIWLQNRFICSSVLTFTSFLAGNYHTTSLPPANVCSLNPCKKSVQWQHCRCLSLLRNLVAGGYVRRDRPGSTSCDNVSLSAFYLTYCQQQKWRTHQVIQIFFWATFMKDRQGGTIYHVKLQRFPFFATTFLLSLTSNNQ